MKTQLLEQTIEKNPDLRLQKIEIVNVKNECTVTISLSICEWS